MANNTIFPSGIDPFDRSQIRWEDYLFALTPVEEHIGMYFKREDLFAPLGYHSINGSKLRQCIWLVNDWVKRERISGIVSGSVVGSPQHPFISSICKHYGIGCLIVTGSKNHQEHKNMQLAKQMGAAFHVAKVTYSRALQSIAFKLRERIPNHQVLETNITVDEKYNTPERIEAFHNIGAYQVTNIPAEVTTLIIPCGSCNSVVSILYGLATIPNNVTKVVLMGIGNNGSFNLQYVPKRLQVISKVTDKQVASHYDWSLIGGPTGNVKIEHHNLNGTGFCSYDDWMPYVVDDIEMHPRYEGKIFNYMKQNTDIFKQYFNKKTLFWIVGNEPKYV